MRGVRESIVSSVSCCVSVSGSQAVSYAKLDYTAAGGNGTDSTTECDCFVCGSIVDA